LDLEGLNPYVVAGMAVLVFALLVKDIAGADFNPAMRLGER
jgi:glycerol uptake facilitator-like aquaporin